MSYETVNLAIENALQDILSAISPHIPQDAMPCLEKALRTYGKLCGNQALIDYLGGKNG